MAKRGSGSNLRTISCIVLGLLILSGIGWQSTISRVPIVLDSVDEIATVTYRSNRDRQVIINGARGGRFLWDISDTTSTVDNGIVFNGLGGVGRLVRQYQNSVNLGWYDLDLANDTAAFVAATSAAGVGGDIVVPKGSYQITSPIELTSGQTLRGVGMATIAVDASISSITRDGRDIACAIRSTNTGSLRTGALSVSATAALRSVPEAGAPTEVRNVGTSNVYVLPGDQVAASSDQDSTTIEGLTGVVRLGPGAATLVDAGQTQYTVVCATGSTSTAYEMLNHGITVKNITVDYSAVSSNTGWHAGIWLDRCSDSKIENCHVHDVVQTADLTYRQIGLLLTDCSNSHVIGGSAVRCRYEGVGFRGHNWSCTAKGTATSGHGVHAAQFAGMHYGSGVYGACVDCTFDRLQASDTRAGASGVGNINDIISHGEISEDPRGNRIINCVAPRIRITNKQRNFVVDNNTVESTITIDVTDSTANARIKDGIISNNTFQEADPSINGNLRIDIGDSSTGAIVERITHSNNTISRTGGSGNYIDVQGSTATVRHIKYVDSTMDISEYALYMVADSGATGTISDIHFEGNTVNFLNVTGAKGGIRLHTDGALNYRRIYSRNNYWETGTIAQLLHNCVTGGAGTVDGLYVEDSVFTGTSAGSNGALVNLTTSVDNVFVRGNRFKDNAMKTIFDGTGSAAVHVTYEDNTEDIAPTTFNNAGAITINRRSFTALDTTPSVANTKHVDLGFSGTVINFDGHRAGKTFTVSGTATLQQGSAINLAKGSDHTLSAGEVLLFRSDGNTCQEITTSKDIGGGSGSTEPDEIVIVRGDTINTYSLGATASSKRTAFADFVAALQDGDVCKFPKGRLFELPDTEITESDLVIDLNDSVLAYETQADELLKFSGDNNRVSNGYLTTLGMTMDTGFEGIALSNTGSDNRFINIVAKGARARNTTGLVGIAINELGTRTIYENLTWHGQMFHKGLDTIVNGFYATDVYYNGLVSSSPNSATDITFANGRFHFTESASDPEAGVFLVNPNAGTGARLGTVTLNNVKIDRTEAQTLSSNTAILKMRGIETVRLIDVDIKTTYPSGGFQYLGWQQDTMQYTGTYNVENLIIQGGKWDCRIRPSNHRIKNLVIDGLSLDLNDATAGKVAIEQVYADNIELNNFTHVAPTAGGGYGIWTSTGSDPNVRINNSVMTGTTFNVFRTTQPITVDKVSHERTTVTSWSDDAGVAADLAKKIGNLPTMDGQTGKLLTVNGTEDGFEWTTPAGGALGSNLSSTTNDLTSDTSLSLISASNQNIDIAPGGTGNVLLGNLTFDADQTVGSGQDNYVLKYDDGTGLISLEAGGGGAGTYLDLTDTPGSFTADRFQIVNDAGTALEDFGAGTNGQLIIGVTGDKPVWAALSGTANEVQVNLGAGTSTISLPSAVDLGPTSSITLDNITMSGNLFTDDGTMRIGGTGGTNNETLDFDFETTANQLSVSSASGVTLLDWGSVLQESDFFTASHTAPYFELEETDAGADEGLWRVLANGSALSIQSLDDAKTGTDTALTVQRQGGTEAIDFVSMGARLVVTDGTASDPGITGSDDDTGFLFGTTVQYVKNGVIQGEVGIDAGSIDFTDLGDTPANYTGAALFNVRVAAGGGLEFTAGVVAKGDGIAPDKFVINRYANGTSPGTFPSGAANEWIGIAILNGSSEYDVDIYYHDGTDWRVVSDPGGSGGLGSNLSSTTDDILSDNGTWLIGGTGNTNNETLDWDFETTANQVAVTSPSGVTVLDLDAFDITVSDEAYNATTWNGSQEVPTKNAVRDQIESLGASGPTWNDEGSVSSTTTIDWTNGDTLEVTLVGNWTPAAPTAPSSNRPLTLIIHQDSTGGYTADFSSWTTVGDPPTVNAYDDATTVIPMYYDGTSYVFGNDSSTQRQSRAPQDLGTQSGSIAINFNDNVNNGASSDHLKMELTGTTTITSISGVTGRGHTLWILTNGNTLNWPASVQPPPETPTVTDEYWPFVLQNNGE